MSNDVPELDREQLDAHRSQWEQERDDADESWMTVIVPGPDDAGDDCSDYELPDSVINPTLRDQQQRALYTMELYIAEARSAIFRGEPFAPPTGYYWERNVIDPLCWSDG